MTNILKVKAGAFLCVATFVLSVFSATGSLIDKRTITLGTDANNVGTATIDVETIEFSSPNLIIKYGTKEEEIINSAPLNPMLTNDKDLDSKIEKIITKITTNDMSNYEKLRALHNYLVQNYHYGSSSRGTRVIYKSGYDAKMVRRAKGILATGQGSCTEFAALFMVAARHIGFDCYSIQGTYAGGDHTWNIIIIDGKEYIFDSEVDYRNSNDGRSATSYKNFCRKSNPKIHAFNKQKNINSFKEFATF
ncbi:MAG: transglutaminase domain-containing protein [Ruminococcaceae bacterium]|nr:transglutaminase domain-containing protein [Oscillospiraceae bacterium]